MTKKRLSELNWETLESENKSTAVSYPFVRIGWPPIDVESHAPDPTHDFVLRFSLGNVEREGLNARPQMVAATLGWLNRRRRQKKK